MTVAALQAMLAKGIDNSLLRFGLGKGCLDAGDAAQAAQHLQRCVAMDPAYSAAWKLLGRALLESGDQHAPGSRASPRHSRRVTSRQRRR